ncbi:MAG: hypothetical protein ABSH44_14865 [Bryobacteraceae bacterium]|jgi:hypothetical protein
MDLKLINQRIDKALALNRRAEMLVIAMASCIFVLGVGIVVTAYRVKNPYITTAGIILQGFLYGPLREILKLRRDNLILQTLPVLISDLPPAQAAHEIAKLLEFLRRR